VFILINRKFKIKVAEVMINPYSFYQQKRKEKIVTQGYLIWVWHIF